MRLLAALLSLLRSELVGWYFMAKLRVLIGIARHTRTLHSWSVQQAQNLARDYERKALR
jgi:hypothetical protein